MVLVGGAGRIQIWSASTGTPITEPLHYFSSVLSANFRTDRPNVAQLGATTIGLISSPVASGPLLAATALIPGRSVQVLIVTKAGVRRWEVATGQLSQETEVRHFMDTIRSFALSSDGSRFAVGGWDEAARLWDATKMIPIGAHLLHQGVVNAVAFHPDGRTFVTAGGPVFRVQGGGEARLWDAHAGQPIGNAMRHPSAVKKVVFSPDGRTLLTACEDGQAFLWRLGQGAAEGVPLRHPESIDRARYTTDGKTILTSNGSAVWRWETTSGKLLGGLGAGQPLKTLESKGGGKYRHVTLVGAPAVNPIGDVVLTAGTAGTDNKEVCFWTLDSGTRVATLTHVYPMSTVAAAVSPDAHTIVVGSSDGNVDGEKAQGSVRIWIRISSSGEPLRYQSKTLKYLGSVEDLAVSTDSKMLLTGSLDKTARLWDLNSGNCVHTFRHAKAVTAVSFGPKGTTILTGDAGGDVRFWDAKTGQGSDPVLRARGAIRSISLNREGNILVTASENENARLWWMTSTATPLGPPLRHRGGVNDVSISPNGKTVLTGSSDGTARRWAVPVPYEGTTERIELWIQLLTNMELDENGAARPLDVARRENYRKRLTGLGGPPVP
jgi:WD40 repeat protein